MPTISGYADGEPIEAVDINQYFLRGNRNAIINGDMSVSQRFSTNNTLVADGAYGLDRWVALGSGTGGVGSSGQNVNVLQSANVPTNAQWAMRLQASTNNLKFGCVQIIENRNLAGIMSGTVTVSFKAYVQSNISDVRCAVLRWNGTADSVTRDIISTSGTPWLSSPPTLAANWSYLNTPVNLNVTGSWAEYRINADVVGSPQNLAVFIWVNSTTHSGGTDGLFLTEVQLESGAIATPFERKTFQEQLADCQRYYEKSYDLTTLPATATTLGYVASSQNVGVSTASWIGASIGFKVSKRAIPTVTVYDVAGNIDRITRLTLGVSSSSNQTATVAEIGQNHAFVYGTGANHSGIVFHYTAAIEL
jgi:hypothetical protein